MLSANSIIKKTSFFFIVILALLPGFACKDELDKLRTFSINSSANFTIPGSIGINTPFNTPSIPMDISQEFAKDNINPNLVKDVTLKKLSLTVVNPSNITFSFLKSIKIYIKADNLPEVLLASRENIGSNPGTYIELTTTNARLDEYIKKQRYTVRAVVETKDTILQDIEIKSDMTFGMMVNL